MVETGIFVLNAVVKDVGCAPTWTKLMIIIGITLHLMIFAVRIVHHHPHLLIIDHLLTPITTTPTNALVLLLGFMQVIIANQHVTTVNRGRGRGHQIIRHMAPLLHPRVAMSLGIFTPLQHR